MSDLLIWNLDDEVRAALQIRAERNARALSAEVRDILGVAAQQSPPDNALVMIDAIFPPELRLTAEEGLGIGTVDHKSDAPNFS